MGTFQPAAGEKILGHFSARRRRKKIGYFSLIRYSSTHPLGQTRYWGTHPSGTKVVGPTVMLAVMGYWGTHPISQKAVMLAVMGYWGTHPISQNPVMLFTMFEPQRSKGVLRQN